MKTTKLGLFLPQHTASSNVADIISPGLSVGDIPLWHLQGNTVIG